jgi:YVTN family beta-propeller protein
MKYLSFIFISGVLVLSLFMTSSECGAANYAYIPNQTDNTVSVIDLADNTVIETINVGEGPTGTAMDVKGSYVYVTNFDDNTVSVISIPFLSETTQIPVGNGPFGVVWSAEREILYVADSLDDTVSVIKSSSVITTIDVGDNPLGITVRPDGRYVYVANNGDNTVTVISTEDEDGNEEFTIEKILDLNEEGMGEGPFGAAISPGGSYVYVTNNLSGTVSVIYTDDNEVTSTIDLNEEGLGEGPLGVVVSPLGSHAFVTNNLSDTVSVISTNSFTVETTVDVGAGPWGVDASNSGDLVYVANNGDNTVSVISTESDEDGAFSVTDTVIVGTTPTGLGKFIGGTVPKAPTDLVGTTVSPFELNLSWTDNSDDEYGFKIERKRYGGIYAQVATVGANVTSYNDTELSSYITYYYRIRAYNDAGNSDYSNQVAATTAQEESGCFISTAMRGSF